ncbi:MAG: phospholipase D family protein [Alphaproteobacteria bacterium]
MAGSFRRSRLSPLVAGAVLAAIAACSTTAVPTSQDQPKSYALRDPASTSFGRLSAQRASAHPDASGFATITSGREAFLSIVALTRLAEKTLDLQYYIWRADTTGRIVLSEIVEAAERGVRVRLLLDDMDLEWEDHELERLSAHPNIEVRLFNPFAGRETGLMDILFDFKRITHRMHNKAYIADNSIAIVGGRNIGDRYFSANEEANYRDLDLYAAGPIVRDISASFDDFWNSDWSIDVSRIGGAGEAPASYGQVREALKRVADAHAGGVYGRDDAPNPPRQVVEEAFDRLVWTGQAALLVDRANKPETAVSALVRELRAKLGGTVQKRLLIETAYLIPGDRGVDALCRFVGNGVEVRVLTNSFASNDVVTAYSGYRKFREPLLRCGVDLYEMRTDAGFVRKDWRWLNASSTAYLHTKAAVLDGQDVVVGSFNLDPRSVDLNTEMALLVRSGRLAEDVTAFIEDGMSPPNAYRLAMEDGDVVWIERSDGKTARLDEEPGVSFWRSLVGKVISFLPLEGQL